MDRIEAKDIQKIADKKAKEIVKYKDVVRQLSTLFEHAIRLGYAQSNPVKKINQPKKTSRPRRDIEHNVYSRKELIEFLDAAQKYNIKVYTYFKLLSSTGLKKALLDYKDSEKISSRIVFHTYKGTYLTLSKSDSQLSSIYRANPNLRKITIHGFRHTFATLLISETDIKPKTVQMLLGHENIQMTLNIYTHVTKKNKNDATDSIRQLDI